MFGLKSASLFGDTKKLEREIDEFVDIVSEVGLVFKSIVPTYLNHSANGKFEEMVEKVKEMESKADKITKDVEPVSYTHLRAHETTSDLVCRLLLDHKYDQFSLQNIEDAFFDLEVIQNQKFFLQEN